MSKILIILFVVATLITVFVSLPDIAFTQGLVQKIGNRCPRNYAPDGSYCKPLAGAKEIVSKIGNRCPSGFANDGDYCYRIKPKPSSIIPKIGNRCPKGYTSDGDYCKSLN